jgi:hypothetical protein
MEEAVRFLDILLDGFRMRTILLHCVGTYVRFTQNRLHTVMDRTEEICSSGRSHEESSQIEEAVDGMRTEGTPLNIED